MAAPPIRADDTPAALAAPSASPAVAVDRESTSVAIRAERSTLTLGVDRGTTLFVTVSGPRAGAALPARTQATVGVLGPLVAGPTPGMFTAEYQVPADRIPQSAIVSVEVLLPDGTRPHATTRLMLPAAAIFPLGTSPYASVSLTVAGQVFGPKKADAEGQVALPIIVPPGVGVGQARAVNGFGIANETTVDLQPRDYPRVLLIAPPGGEAGTAVDVEAWAVEPSGEPSAPEDIDLRASSGTVRRAGGMPGLARFAFTLPARISHSTGLGMGAVALVAATDDGSSMRPDAMFVRAGPAAQIAITSDVKRLVVASQTVAHVEARAQDRFGNDVPAPGLLIRLEGQALATRETSGGVAATVTAPPRWPGQDHLKIEAHLGQIHATLSLPIGGGPPARARMTASRIAVDGDGKTPVDFRIEVFDERGTPTAAARVAWQTDDEGVVDFLPASGLGAYAVRFVPRRANRDRTAVMVATIDGNLSASARVVVESRPTRNASFRVGVASNLGSSFGQTAFVEATVPLARIAGLGSFGRLLSAGLSLGYVHSELASSPATLFPALHLDVNQAPILAVGRVRLPGHSPVEISFSGTAGWTFASTEISTSGDPAPGPSRANAHALVLGGGADAAFQLEPGELVIGARYLHAELGRTSDGDHLERNVLGFICDLGFRLGF